MKTYVYASACDRDLSFRKNQVRTMFSALKPDLVTTLLEPSESDTIKYDDYLNVSSISFMTHMRYDDYVTLKKILEPFDFVVIQSYGCRVLGQNVDAYTVFDAGVVSRTRNWTDADFRNAYRSWTIAAHIKACIELRKPFMLYTFDPMIDSNFGIDRMHGFTETRDMRYIPLMEQGALDSKWQQYEKTLDFVYSARLSIFDFNTTERLKLHKAIAQTEFKRSKVHFDVELENKVCQCSRGMLPITGGEDAYIEEVSKAKFTICPPNYDGRCYSIKRAIDAIKVGTIPLFLGFVDESNIDDGVWRPIIDLQHKYRLYFDNLDAVSRVDDFERREVLQEVYKNISEQCFIERSVRWYMQDWPKFKIEYAPFAFKD